jgi:very-short-patch-repair endonuclease
MDVESIEAWALAHHGLVPLAMMRQPGEDRPGTPSVWSWRRAVRSGHLELVHPGVARLRGAPRTREQRIAAAQMAVGGSIASHRSAAFLWGLDRPAHDPVDLIVTRRGGRRIELAGVEVHRPRDLLDLTPSVRSGISCTNPLRTLCDLAAVDADSAPAMVEHVLVSGWARPTGLRALVARHGRPGRVGVTALREAVDAWPLGDKPADSVLEPRFASLLERHRLPPAEFHAVIEGHEVDFLIVGTPVVVECDGWEFHVKSRDAARRDRERDSKLLAAGYPTVRFTWEHITRRPTFVAQRLATVLRRWAPEVLAA